MYGKFSKGARKIQKIFKSIMVAERIGLFIKEKGISVNSFEKMVGLSAALMAKALQNGTSIRSDTLEKILETFPELSAEWLLRGKGEMFLTSTESIPKPSHTMTVENHHNNTVIIGNWDELRDIVREELERNNKK